MLLELLPISADNGAVAELYSDPYIARVGHDHRPAAPLIHPAVQYMGAYAYGQLVGAFLIIKSGFIESDVHALLTRRALPHSRAFGRMCLDYIFSNPAIERVTAYIIDGLKAAMNYCIKLGFKKEGCRRCACMQGGVLKDVYVLGMTRQEWSLR